MEGLETRLDRVRGKLVALSNARSIDQDLRASAVEPAFAQDFDWNSNQAEVVIPEQAETAIYTNPNGAVVIRQRAWPEDDTFVVIAPENLMIVIDRLCDLAGIGSAGGR